VAKQSAAKQSMAKQSMAEQSVAKEIRNEVSSHLQNL
jgi:hypothetical protein